MKKLDQKKPLISIFNRKPQEANFSVERLFHDVVAALPSDLDYISAISTFESRGIFRRFFNIIEAFFKQNEVNHITGDVHYLSYLLPKKNTLLTILDCGSLERLKGLKRAVLYIFWYWLPVKRVSIITVISESTKRELLRYVKCDESKIRVIPCCISNEFKSSPKEFNSTLPVLLQIGTAHNKNLLKVTEALVGIQCHVRIVGKLSDEQVSQLVSFNISYSCVSNLSDAEIVSEYIKCDALIFASTYEGFGMPIVEANATGRPVITSNILSMPEVAADAACLVDPYDVLDIRRGVLRVLSDENYRNTLIARGYVNAQRFRPNLIANQYAQIYREMISINSRSNRCKNS